MTQLATSPPAGALEPHAAERTTAGAVREVVLLSLLVTAVAALVALAPAVAVDMRWSLAFVYVRWYLVFALLVAPLLHRAALRRGWSWRLPWGLRTPATALLLTCEGIVWDIVSAHLRG